MVHTKKIPRYLILLFSLLLFSFCENRTELKPEPASNRVKQDEKLLIKLPENHQDGFTWSLNDNYDHEVVVQEKSVWHGAESGVYFYLKTRVRGKTDLRFVKRNYTDTSDIKRFAIIVGD